MNTLKTLLTVSAVAAAVVLSGCTSAPQYTADDCWYSSTEPGAPAWKCAPDSEQKEGFHFFVGSFKSKTGDQDFAEVFARQSAINKLSELVNTEFTGMAERYKEETAADDLNSSADNAVLTLRTLSNNSFSGAKVFKHAISPSGTYFVLVGIPTENINSAIDRMKNKFKKQQLELASADSKAKANRAFERMDEEVEKLKRNLTQGLSH